MITTEDIHTRLNDDEEIINLDDCEWLREEEIEFDSRFGRNMIIKK